ncbi:MAG: twin-arginine translocase TatA/TatE family subunit [Ilumatobacteraceae bacterium]
MDIGPPELILILVVVLVLFGGAQLPKLAKNLGKAQHEFKTALEEARGETGKAENAAPAGSSPTEAEPRTTID